MNKVKKGFCSLILSGVLVLSAASAFTASAQAQDSVLNARSSAFASYTYNNWGQAVECPVPYTLAANVTGTDLGIGDFKKPNDIFADTKGFLYVAVSGDEAADNRIIKLDSALKVVKIWQGFSNKDGDFVSFSEPLGVFISPEDSIYVADGFSKNIIEMNQNGMVIRVIGAPKKQDSAIVTDDFIDRYRPSKLVVDSSGRLHVVAVSVNEGIVDFSPEGKFEGFLAAGKVNANPVEIIWKKLSTQAQLDKMADFVPIEYSNIALDKEDFVFATAAAIDLAVVKQEINSGVGTEFGALVRRLNMMGKDTLKRNGFGPPSGDYDIMSTFNNSDAAYKGISRMVDVATGDDGTYTVLDDNRGRLFTYDNEGNLLYAFGGPDVTAGGFRTPVSLAVQGSSLYVLDSGSRSILHFRRTEFAENIAKAIESQESGDYKKSAEIWADVLASNANYDLAYSGIGKAAYRDGEYEKAMEYFELGYNKDWYSRAYKEYRKAVVADKFAAAAAVAGAGIIAVFISVKALKYRKKLRMRGE